MKIPDKVRIGGFDFAIRYEDGLNDGERMLLGEINYAENKIKLAPGIQSKQGENQTLWHEIMHGIAQHFELAINEDEDTIDKLAKGVHMVIMDNPGMFEQ